MTRFTQEEIDEMIASGEADRMIDEARKSGDAFVVDGPALIAVFHAARTLRPDDEIDAAVTAARRAGHTWTEIERVLSVIRPHAAPR